MTEKETCRFVGKMMPDYLGGKCTEAEKILITEHCAHCSECAGFLEELKRTREESKEEYLFLSRLLPSECSGGSEGTWTEVPAPQKSPAPLQRKGSRQKQRKDAAEKPSGNMWLILPSAAKAAVLLLLLAVFLYYLLSAADFLPKPDSGSMAPEKQVRAGETVQEYGCVTAAGADLYDDLPSAGGKMTGSLDEGEVVFVEEAFSEMNGRQWYRILTADGKEVFSGGWHFLVPYEADSYEESETETDSEIHADVSEAGEKERVGSGDASGPVVNRDNVNLRSSPTTEGNNIIGSLNKGDQVTILDTVKDKDGNEWYQILLSNGNISFVVASAIYTSDDITSDESSAVASENSPKEIVGSEDASGFAVNRDNVNLRSSPTIEGNNIIGSLNKGNQVTILDTVKDKDGNEWYQILLSNGNIGYISASMVSGYKQ